MTQLPVLDEQSPSDKSPVLLTTPTKDKRWAFSFRYWQQIEYFGLDQSKPKWFVSLLEKLKDLSNKEVDKFITSADEMNAWRYHPINWNQQNIPIKRNDLYWVDAVYRDNFEEYPILQFQVSKSLGRVIGFWDENNVFNIVLLDPLHNIQPSKDFNYKVDNCSLLTCEYSALLSEVEALKQNKLCKNECGYHDLLAEISTRSVSKNVLMHFLSDEDKAKLDSVITDKSTYTDVLMIGVEFLEIPPPHHF